MSKEEYLEMTRSAAEPIAQFRGCLWKIWLLNEAEQEAGGIYLFENARAVQEYLDSPIVGRMASHPEIEPIQPKNLCQHRRIDRDHPWTGSRHPSGCCLSQGGWIKKEKRWVELRVGSSLFDAGSAG